MADHDTLRDLVDLVGLGGLSAEERRAVEEHLADCADCRQRAQEALAVSHVMGHALEPVAPPSDLRARTLARVRATAREPAAESRPASGAVRSPSGWRTRDWLAAAAALVAVVAGVQAWTYRQQAAATVAEVQGLRHQLARQEQQIATLEAAAQHLQQTSAVLTAVDLSLVDLGGQPPAPVATGRVFWSASHGLVFSATNLPPLPPGQVYQLWVVGEAPRSAGIVTPDAAGNLNVVSREPVPAQPKAFALTIEPAGGRPAPTGPMFLLGAM